MLNIIKADIYRILRGKAIYITLILLLALQVLQVNSQGQSVIGVDLESVQNPDAFTTIVNEQGETSLMYTPPERVFTGKNAPLELAKSTDNLIYFLLAFIVFISSADFSSATVKNLLAAGVSKHKYFFAKLILVALGCVLLMFVYIAAPMINGTIRNGFGGAFDARYIKDLASVYLPQLYLLFTFGCIGVFISFTLKSTAWLNALYIAFSLVPVLIISILGDYNDKYIKYYDYDLVFNLKAFGYTADTFAFPPDLTRALILGGVYIIMCITGGIFLFRKSEIK